jgi:hypothetical protein
MTTLATVIEEVIDEVYGTYRSQVNFLAAVTTAVDTTFILEDELKGLGAGSLLSLGTELVYVRSVDAQLKTALVRRGFRGTALAIHAIGDMCEVNPRFPRHMITRAIETEIRSWPENLLFQVAAFEISTSLGTRNYDATGLPANFKYLLDLAVLPSDTHGFIKSARFDIHKNMPLADYPSGVVITLLDSPPLGNMVVSYSYPFDLSGFPVEATDLETDCGLATSMIDIVRWGALYRLVAPREIKRNFTEGQGESRTAEEVPALTTLQSAQVYKRMRDMALREEALRLRADWPYRKL